MLFKRAVLEGIRAGRITLAFRRWRRPTVKAGGRLRTDVGVLAIDAVDLVEPATITAAEARQAGYGDRAALLAALAGGPDAPVHRIALRYLGAEAEPRPGRADAPPPGDEAALRRALAGLDRRAPDGPWTHATLALIAARPGRPARELATARGDDPARFKRRVRRLARLGLTASLPVGYRLTPRGQGALAAVDATPSGSDRD